MDGLGVGDWGWGDGRTGEPEHWNAWNDDPAAAGHSVWYRWTAPANGQLLFTTSAEVVDVYTGGFSRPTHDRAWDCDDYVATPECKFVNVVAGTVYRIAVEGYERGFQLNWRRITAPANDNFANATVLSGLTADLTAPNEGGDLATAEPGEPRHGFEPYAPAHSLWFSWTAPWTTDVNIQNQVGQQPHDECDWASVLAVYTGSSVSALRQVASDVMNPATGVSLRR